MHYRALAAFLNLPPGGNPKAGREEQLFKGPAAKRPIFCPEMMGNITHGSWEHDV